MGSGKLLPANRVSLFVTLMLPIVVGWWSFRSTSVERVLISATVVKTLLSTDHLLDGDLVFRTGRDLASRLVLAQGETERFSHVGVVLRERLGPVVVHALPADGATLGGVIVEPLASFASSENAVDFGAYRIRSITSPARQQIRDYLLRQLGKPFDDEFKLSDDREMYCTELALKSLTAAGIDVSGSLPPLQVMMLPEPVVPPDYLRRSRYLYAVSAD